MAVCLILYSSYHNWERPVWAASVCDSARMPERLHLMAEPFCFSVKECPAEAGQVREADLTSEGIKGEIIGHTHKYVGRSIVKQERAGHQEDMRARTPSRGKEI